MRIKFERIMMICSVLLFLFSGRAFCGSIHPHGYWEGEDVTSQHCFDPSLAEALVDFFKREGAQSIVDFGCGAGTYVQLLRSEYFDSDGFDGNPATPLITQGTCGVIDLSIPFDLSKRYDWVLSLEVGEHLPPQYERIFIENLDRHNVQGIVLSWAIRGQGGIGHFNEQNNDYIKSVLASYGYVNDIEAEKQLREAASIYWFKNTVMIFRKMGTTSPRGIN